MHKVLHILLTDVTHDSRMNKESKTLHEKMGLELTVFGLHDNNLPLEEKQAHKTIKRFPLMSRSWPKVMPAQLIKFVECGMRMLREAQKLKPDVVHAHSLEALPISANIASRLQIPLVYDAHEFETKVEASLLSQKLREITEKKYIRHADAVLCVSESIAAEYAGMYRIEMPRVILNCPPHQTVTKQDLFRRHFGISPERRIYLYQGLLASGRGLPQMLEAFSALENAPVDLVIMGYGPGADVVADFAKHCMQIHYKEAVSPDELLDWTASADIGFSMNDNTCLNNYYCLPNKVFEYLMAGLPLICSQLFELEQLVTAEGIGWIVKDNTAEGIQQVVLDSLEYDLTPILSNVKKAASIYNWEAQEKKLIDIYANLPVLSR